MLLGKSHFNIIVTMIGYKQNYDRKWYRCNVSKCQLFNISASENFKHFCLTLCFICNDPDVTVTLYAFSDWGHLSLFVCMISNTLQCKMLSMYFISLFQVRTKANEQSTSSLKSIRRISCHRRSSFNFAGPSCGQFRGAPGSNKKSREVQ